MSALKLPQKDAICMALHCHARTSVTTCLQELGAEYWRSWTCRDITVALSQDTCRSDTVLALSAIASMLSTDAHLIDDGHSHQEAAEGEEVGPHTEGAIHECIVGIWQSRLGFMHKLCRKHRSQ